MSTSRASILFFLLAVVARAEEPRLARERIVLHTSAGGFVVALFPDVAPTHVAQILRLVKLGVYDSTYFYVVDPSFAPQTSTAQQRRLPLTPEQLAAIQRIPGEFSDNKHVRGTVTMARDLNDPDSAETSFAILYTAVPHLDGKFTVFGRLERGDEVLDAIAKVARDAQNRPLQTIEIIRAEVADSPEAAPKAMGYQPPFARSPDPGGVGARPATPLLALVGLMIATGLATFFLAGRVPPRLVGSIGLLTALVGQFLLFTALGTTTVMDPWLATLGEVFRR